MPIKKLDSSLIMTTIIERAQHDRLRELAFYNRLSMAELVRDALAQYLKTHTIKRNTTAGRPKRGRARTLR